VGLAYLYLLSAFIGMAIARFRQRGTVAEPATPTSEPRPATRTDVSSIERRSRAAR
jgi:hypothetical protein